MLDFQNIFMAFSQYPLHFPSCSVLRLTIFGMLFLGTQVLSLLLTLLIEKSRKEGEFLRKGSTSLTVKISHYSLLC